MRRIRQVALTAIVTLAASNTASAGEPFHPFYQPIVDVFRWFGGWF